MIKASIDIGSNSVLLLVKDGDKILENKANVTALGKNIDKTGLFAQESMDETYKVLESYKNLILEHKIEPQNVVVTATEASRVVKNAKEFFAKILNELGLEIIIISGEQEAYYSTMGVLSSGYSNEIVSIMDIGGASTELVKVQLNPFKILNFVSMPIGAVRINDSRDKEEYIESILKDYDLNDYRGELMISTAGTMTSLAAMMLNLSEYNDSKVHDSKFSLESLNELKNKIASLTESDLDHQYPFLEKRRFTIMSGLLLAESILQKMSFDNFFVSSRGLRYGTIDMEKE
jgi:exopolyphosphatase/guanosine-5'-triphosphate,3'-diphosphate pyrophosphatase